MSYQEGLQNPETAATSKLMHGPEALALFKQLRLETHLSMRRDLLARIAMRPELTPEEEMLGLYTQSIEPQIVAAALSLNQKGYRTGSSGFMGVSNSHRQHMQFTTGAALGDDVIRNLDIAKVAVQEEFYSDQMSYELSFTPEMPDLDAITEQWNAVAACLPDLGYATTGQRSHFSDRAFVVNSLSMGLCMDELVGSPLVSRALAEEVMGMYHFTTGQERVQEWRDTTA
jgi:hypothetical protein